MSGANSGASPTILFANVSEHVRCWPSGAKPAAERPRTPCGEPWRGAAQRTEPLTDGHPACQTLPVGPSVNLKQLLHHVIAAHAWAAAPSEGQSSGRQGGARHMGPAD